MDRLAVIGHLRREGPENASALVDAGPPYELASAGLDRHAVYLSGRHVVFVFEGLEIESGAEDLADALHPEARAALSRWRELLDEEPDIGRPVFAWERGSPSEADAVSAKAVRVGDVMEPSFVAVAPEDTLGEAVERMVAHGDAPALVTDFGRLIGVLSGHDVLRAVAARVHPSDGRAREWMQQIAAEVTPDASLGEAAARMIEAGLHHLPVVDDERPVGIVALRDVVGARPRATV